MFNTNRLIGYGGCSPSAAERGLAALGADLQRGLGSVGFIMSMPNDSP